MGPDTIQQFDMLDYGVASNAGTRYGGLNQDFGVVQPVVSPAQSVEQASHTRQQCYVAAVLDGHGILGNESARLAGKAVMRYLCHSDIKTKSMHDWKNNDIKHFMEQSFKWAHLAGMAVYEHPPQETEYMSSHGQRQKYKLQKVKNQQVYSSRQRSGAMSEVLLECGATCSMAVIEGDRLWVANVGDSTVVLGSKREDGSLDAEAVSVTHNCLNMDEQKRLQSKGHNKISLLNDGYLRVEEGDWAGYELAMTRALGHKLLAKFGVVYSPSILIRQLQSSDVCLILASDGVWDAYSHKEAVDLVMSLVSQGKSARQAAEILVNSSVEIVEKQGLPADNTTAIVFLIHPNI